MSATDLVGYIAAALTTASFVPQVWHSLRTRDFNGLSLRMYVLFCAGITLWLVYGLLLAQWPIILANAVTLLLAGSILVLAWWSRGVKA